MEGLKIKPDGIYVDLTFGGGGHSRAIIEKLGKSGRLFAFDCDADAENNKISDERFIFIRSNFVYFKNFLRYFNYTQVDGIIADLGLSWHQIDDTNRGFAFGKNTNLDMRMNKELKHTAAYIINNYEENRLSELFYNYGEVENSRKLAYIICNERKNNTIDTSEKFIQVIKPCIPFKNENRYLAKVFQALRIEVNHELDSLKAMLLQIPEALKINGRFVIITYHSLEDRVVKNFIRNGDFDKDEDDFISIQGKDRKIWALKPVNKKVIVPADDEIMKNNKARSAKLRIAEKFC